MIMGTEVVSFLVLVVTPILTPSRCSLYPFPYLFLGICLVLLSLKFEKDPMTHYIKYQPSIYKGLKEVKYK